MEAFPTAESAKVVEDLSIPQGPFRFVTSTGLGVDLLHPRILLHLGCIEFATALSVASTNKHFTELSCNRPLHVNEYASRVILKN